jgi:hypothetical protein
MTVTFSSYFETGALGFDGGGDISMGWLQISLESGVFSL